MEEKKNNKKTNHDPTTKEHSSRGRQSPLLAACSRGTRQKRCCWGDCLNSMTNKGLTMHGFQGALFSFLCFYFLFFVLFYFIFLLFFLFNFCVLATPRRTVCFWFLPLRLHGKFSFSFFRDGNVQILSLYTFIYFFLHCSSCCLLFIAESEARLKGWQLLGLFRPFE